VEIVKSALGAINEEPNITIEGTCEPVDTLQFRVSASGLQKGQKYSFLRFEGVSCVPHSDEKLPPELEGLPDLEPIEALKPYERRFEGLPAFEESDTVTSSNALVSDDGTLVWIDPLPVSSHSVVFYRLRACEN